MRLARSLALAAVAAAALAACGTPSQPSTTPPSASAATLSLVVDLSARQEVPPNASTATGRATVTMNRATRLLTWSVTYSGLTGPVTGAHIHVASEGSNGPVVIPFTVTPSPITGSTTLTEAQAIQLSTGLMYVNLHTAANPGGEIRGQLK